MVFSMYVCDSFMFVRKVRKPQVPFFKVEFSVPQIEYPLGGSSKTGSHVYFLLIVAMVLLLWCQVVLL